VEKAEVIMNLWCICDQDDKVIYGLAGRAYCVSGTDEEKTALLKQLALTDFGLANRMPVPDRFSVEVKGELMTGICSLSELNNKETTLFQEMYEELQAEIDSRYNGSSTDEGQMRITTIPQNPLFLLTALVEENDGSIKAMMMG